MGHIHPVAAEPLQFSPAVPVAYEGSYISTFCDWITALKVSARIRYLFFQKLFMLELVFYHAFKGM